MDERTVFGTVVAIGEVLAPDLLLGPGLACFDLDLLPFQVRGLFNQFLAAGFAEPLHAVQALLLRRQRLHIFELLIYFLRNFRLAPLLWLPLIKLDDFPGIIFGYLDLFVLGHFVVDDGLQVVLLASFDHLRLLAHSLENVSCWLATALLLGRLVKFDYFNFAGSLDFSLF